MTSLEAIDRLIEAVEDREDGGAKWLDRALGPIHGKRGLEAYRSSIDAAKALHEALLPGWEWQHGFSVGGQGPYAATVWLPHQEDTQWKVYFAVSENPARAWLLAILRAHRHQIAAGEPQ